MHFYPSCNTKSISPDCSGFVQMSKDKKISVGIPVDQYFAQPQNMVLGGVIDTSPIALDSSSAVGHSMALTSGHCLPRNMSDSDAHDTIIPRDMQSPSELQVLSRLRPASESVEQSEVNDSPKSDVAPVASSE